ncbi:MAG: Na(+)-translocating NADH-quinone reductase subunit A [Cyclobacteriaceae bacterium]|nr:Na(+)-translocating NADH-quinone reductase subunit A [Cyclobacteriaceae bacterium]
MPQSVTLKKGFNIKLSGKAVLKLADSPRAETFAVKISGFHGISRPKVLVQEGENVKAGTPVFIDKKNPDVLYTSPVSGEVVEIRRGEKRALKEVIILGDKKIEYEVFQKHSISEIINLSKEDVTRQLLSSGVWPVITQRPFGIIANPSETPKSIFISGFDSHPLAPDYDFIFKGDDKYFQTGIEILKKFTDGTIHLNIDGNSEVIQMFAHAKDVQINKFHGPHPSGNVGIQIHHLDPINKGEIVWTITPFGVIQMGKLFLEGIYDASKKVALVGPEVKNPQYYQTYTGSSIRTFVKDNVKTDNPRYISGNVLTGERVEEEGHMRYHDHMITVIEEGDKHKAFGWVLPSINKPSFHRALGLLAFLFPKKEYNVDSNMNGEPRAFVQTGVFEKVLPMDILPTYLIKAILADDFDEIEALGIYELIEEDLALCEFVDVSKHEIQAILREGLDLIHYS